MELNFEKFEEGARYRPHGNIHVSVDDRGRVFFNKHALEALGSPDGVSLMYDRAKRVIGVQATPLNHKSTYQLRRGSGGGLISINNFMNAYGITDLASRAFPKPGVQNGVLLLDLNKTVSIKREKPRVE